MLFSPFGRFMTVLGGSLTQVMIQFAPGKTQSLHRHPGEAWLYVVEGYGHSFLGIAPDQGQHYRWKKGDLIVVDHYLWHQHFNDDPVNQCRLVRVHMFDSILETIGDTPIDTPVGPLTATVSIGVSQWHVGETIEAVFDRADTALYAAKESGRNRVCGAGTLSAAPPTTDDDDGAEEHFIYHSDGAALLAGCAISTDRPSGDEARTPPTLAREAHALPTLVAHVFGGLEGVGSVGVEHHLHQTLAVTQVDEDHAAVVTATVGPAHQRHGLAHQRFADQTAVCGAHCCFLRG